MRAGDSLGPYELIDLLGQGGNAVVWRACGPAGDVALKILNKRDPASEPYARFRREIQQLDRLGATPGVLPLLDYNLPGPGQTGRAWLAMPIAERVTIALGSSPTVELVVAAIRDIATTLAGLHDQGLAHRDVKPDNLYRHAGSWAIGDFGLVDAPEVEPLTTGATALGPRHFLAPEMLADPARADGAKADVYSLGKTLWVLATGQSFPPPGEHRLDERSLRISSFAAHPRATSLDVLMVAMSRHAPDERPSMWQVADELKAWLAAERPTPPGAAAPVPALERLALRVGASGEAAAAREQARVARQEAVWRVADDLATRAEPLAEVCRRAGFRVFAQPDRRGGSSFDTDATDLARMVLGPTAADPLLGADRPLLRALGLSVMSEPALPSFKVFLGAHSLRGSDELTLFGGTAVLHASQSDVLSSCTRRALVDGPAMAAAMSEIVEELATALPDDIAAWVDRLESLARE